MTKENEDANLEATLDRIDEKLHIKYRIKNMDIIPNDRFEQGRRLKSLKITLSKFLSWRKENENIIERAMADLKDADKYIEVMNKAIDEIEQDKSIIITEHAVLRYLQRHKGIDLNQVTEEIVKLDPKYIKRNANTIITVYSQDQYADEE